MRRIAGFIFVAFFFQVRAQDAMWMTALRSDVTWNGIICDNQGDVYAYGTTEKATHGIPNSTVVISKLLKEGTSATTYSVDLPFYNLKMAYDGHDRFYFTAVFARTFFFKGRTYAVNGGFDAVTGCMDKAGDIKWISVIGSTANDELPAICFNADSTGLVVSGTLSGDLNFNGKTASPSSNTTLLLAEIGLDGSLGKYRMFDFDPHKNGYSAGKEIFIRTDGDIILLAIREGAPYVEENPAQPYAGHYVYRISPSFDVKWERMLMNESCYYGNYSGVLRKWNDHIMASTFCSNKYGGTGTLMCLESGSGNTLWSRSNRDGFFYDGRSGPNSYFFLTTDDANACPCPSFFVGYNVLRETDHLLGEHVILKADRGLFRCLAQNTDGMTFVYGIANDTALVNGHMIVNAPFIIGIGNPLERNVTSVSDDKEMRIRVYPNPTNGTIRIDAQGVDVTAVVLRDIQGRELHTMPAMTNEINLRGLTPGVYFLDIRTSGEAVVRRKVILQQ